MNNTSPVVQPPAIPASASPKERILFETRPLVLPAILTFENLTLVGIIVVIGLVSFVTRLGPYELLIIALLWSLLAFPSFRQIFSSGSTTYVLTNRRLVIFTVSLRQKEQSIPLEEVQSAVCKHSGLQRLYGAGDILVLRKGLRKPVRLRALANCKAYAEQINRAAKERRI